MPCSGNPLMASRRHTPSAAYPNKVIAFFVPKPIAWYPLHIFAFRFLWGWLLFQWFWGSPGCDGSWLRLDDYGDSKSLMHRPARQNLRFGTGRLSRLSWLIARIL